MLPPARGAEAQEEAPQSRYSEDVRFLVKQSRTQFLGIRAPSNEDTGIHDTAFALPELTGVSDHWPLIVELGLGGEAGR